MASFQSRFTRYVYKQWFFPWMVCAGISILVFVSVIVCIPSGKWFIWKQHIVQPVISRDFVIAANQRVGNDYLIIGRVRLTRPGFVVVISTDRFDSPSDYTLGESALLGPGTYMNVSIRMHPDDFVFTPPAPKIQLGALLIVKEYYDNGNGIFDLEDREAKDVFGNAIQAAFISI